VVASSERGQLLVVVPILIPTVVLSSVVLLNSVHDSLTVQTQQDTRSVKGVDRTVGELTSDRDRLFAANTSNATTAGPYADASDLTQLVATYEQTRLNLSTTDQATTLNETVNATGDATDTVAIAETPTKIDDTGYNLTNVMDPAAVGERPRVRRRRTERYRGEHDCQSDDNTQRERGERSRGLFQYRC